MEKEFTDLKELKKLFDEKAISKEEYYKLKKELIGDNLELLKKKIWYLNKINQITDKDFNLLIKILDNDEVQEDQSLIQPSNDNFELKLKQLEYQIESLEINMVKPIRILNAGKAFKTLYNCIVIQLIWAGILTIMSYNPELLLSILREFGINIPNSNEGYIKFIGIQNNINSWVELGILSFVLFNMKTIYMNLIKSKLVGSIY